MQWRNEFRVESPNMHRCIWMKSMCARAHTLFASFVPNSKSRLNSKKVHNNGNERVILFDAYDAGRAGAACLQNAVFHVHLSTYDILSFCHIFYFYFRLILNFIQSYRCLSSCLRISPHTLLLRTVLVCETSSVFIFLEILIELYYNKLPSTPFCHCTPATHGRKYFIYLCTTWMNMMQGCSDTFIHIYVFHLIANVDCYSSLAVHSTYKNVMLHVRFKRRKKKWHFFVI